MNRAEVTEKILSAKRLNGLTWEEIANRIGGASKIVVTAACMGQMKMTGEQAGDMRVLIEQIAKSLVDEPEQVAVQAVEEDGGTVLELKVAPNDLGKVIGKQGRTARAMRTLLGAASMKLHRRYSLEILE